MVSVRQGVTLACAWLAAFNARAPLLAIGPLLPLVIVDLGLSFTMAGLLSGLALLLMGVAGLPGGWLVDRVGARQVMVGSLIGITVAGLMRGLAPNEGLLLAGTLVLGLAIGVLQPALPRAARDTLPRRVGLASAIYFNGLVVGGAAGLAVTPLLVPMLGWRGVLLAWACLGGLATVGWLAVGEARHVERHSGGLHLADITAALRLPGLAALTLAMGTQSAIFYTFGSWTPAFLVARGWTLASATLPLATLPLMSIVAGTVATPLEARLGRRTLIAMSGVIVSVGLAVFVVWPDQTVWLAAVTAGIGTTWAFSVCMAAPATLAPAPRVGLTAGVLLALGYGEATLGPLALGALRDASGSYTIGWLLALAMALVLTATALGVPGRDRASSNALGLRREQGGIDVDPTMLAGQALALLSPYLTRIGEAAVHQAGEAAAEHAEALLSAIRRQFGADHDGFAEQTLDAVIKQPDEPSPKQALQGIVASKVEKDPAFKAELERLLKEAKDDSQTQQFLVQVYGHGKVNEIFQIHTVNTINVGRHDTSD